jgi:hypothetical protein
MGNPKTYHFKLPPYQGPPLPEPPHSWFPGVQAHHAASTSDRTLRSDGKIRAFVIHATAGNSSAGAMNVMFSHRVSWHWLIPDEVEIVNSKTTMHTRLSFVMVLFCLGSSRTGNASRRNRRIVRNGRGSEGGVANSRRIGQLLRWSDEVDVVIFALDGGVPMYASSLVTSEVGAMWLLRLARSLPIDATPLCMTSVRSATQYRRIRSLIQIEAQTYRILPIIPNTTPTFLVQRANGAVQKIVVHGLVIKAAKDCPASTLTMIAVKT